MRRLLACSLLLSASLIGCGSGIPDDPPASPFATIQGTITNPLNLQTSPGIRLAIVWRAFGERQDPQDYFQVSQEMAVRAQFPLQFAIDLTQIPPEAAMNDRTDVVCEQPGPCQDEDCICLQERQVPYSYALGSIVVYDDLNGNGQLDLLSTNSDQVEDAVLGVPERVVVAYVEGTPPAVPTADGSVLGKGFNLIELVDERIGELSWSKQKILPPSTVVPIPLTGAPGLVTYLCQNLPQPDESTILPLLEPGELTCAPDGRSYAYESCATSFYPVCAQQSSAACLTGGKGLQAEEAPPAGWPCTIDPAVKVEYLATTQSECKGNVYDPYFASQEAASLTVTGNQIEINYVYAHFRCEQAVHIKFVQAGTSITLYAEPKDMNPTNVVACDCLYDLSATTPALAPGSYTVELIRKWDNISGAATKSILQQTITIP